MAREALFVKIGADATKFERAMGKVANSAHKAGLRSEKAFARAKKAFAVSTVAIGAMAGGLAFALKKFADFQNEMNTVEAITRATDAQMKEMAKSARELGATTRFTAKEAASGMKFLGMAGFNTNQILAAIPATLDLAAAGALGLGEAADIATNVLTGFRLRADQTTRVVDIMAITASSANTDIRQMGEAMTFVSGIAQSAGLTLEETSAVIGALAAGGAKGSIAGTSLGQALNQILKPGRDLSENLAQLRESLVDASTGGVVPLTEMMQKLEAANLSTGEVLELFGIRGARAIFALQAAGEEGIGKLLKKFKEGAGAGKEMALIMEKGLPGAFRRTSSAFDDLILTIGKIFAPVVEKAIRKVIVPLISKMSDWAKTHPELIKDIVRLALVVGGLTATVSGLFIIKTLSLVFVKSVLAMTLGMKSLGLAAKGAGIVGIAIIAFEIGKLLIRFDFVNRAIQRVITWFKKLKTFAVFDVKQMRIQVVKDFNNIQLKLARFIRWIAQKFINTPVIGKFLGAFTDADKAAQELDITINRLTKRNDNLAESIKDIENERNRELKAIDETVKGLEDEHKLKKDVQKELTKELDMRGGIEAAIQEQNTATKEMADSAKRAAEGTEEQVGKMIEAWRKFKDAQEQAAEGLLNIHLRWLRATGREAKAVLLEIENEYKKQTDILKGQLERREISQEQYNQAIKELEDIRTTESKEALEEIARENRKTIFEKMIPDWAKGMGINAETLMGFVDTFKRNIQEGIVNTLSFNLEKVKESWKGLYDRMIARVKLFVANMIIELGKKALLLAIKKIIEHFAGPGYSLEGALEKVKEKLGKVFSFNFGKSILFSSLGGVVNMLAIATGAAQSLQSVLSGLRAPSNLFSSIGGILGGIGNLFTGGGGGIPGLSSVLDLGKNIFGIAQGKAPSLVGIPGIGGITGAKQVDDFIPVGIGRAVSGIAGAVGSGIEAAIEMIGLDLDWGRARTSHGVGGFVDAFGGSFFQHGGITTGIRPVRAVLSEKPGLREAVIPLTPQYLRLLGSGGGGATINLNIAINNDMLDADSARRLNWRDITHNEIFPQIREGLKLAGEDLGTRLEVF